MNEGDIKREIQRAWEWQQDEANALCNSLLWLTQAANNETPHGGIQCPSVNPVATPSKTVMSSSNPTEPEKSTMKTVTETEAVPSGTATSTDTEWPTMSGPEMMPWTEASNE